MKNSGVEWIGEIPEDWEVKKLKYICEPLASGGTPDSNNDQYYCENGTNWVAINDMSLVDYVENTAKHITNLAINEKKLKIYPKGTIIYSIYATLGHVAELSKPACINQALLALSIKDKSFNKSYFKYSLNAMKEYVLAFSSGNTQFNLNAQKVRNFTLLTPSFETQQRIATYLDKKCSKIEETIQNQQQVIEKLKAYKQSLITEAVTGKIKIQNGKVCGKYESYKDSKLKWLGDFKIPEKWSNIQVKSFVSIPVVDGPHESPELFDNGIPYISATAIENSKIDFSLKRGFISEKYCDECDKRYKPMRDDILMIKLGATTGQVAIVETDERFNIWVPLAAIRCNKNIALPKFIFYSFQSDYCLKQMEMSWTFGTQQTLGVSSIERLKIFLPNIETQKNITHFLDKKCTAIDTAIEQKQMLIEKLTEYKKSLIYECVTGKKEI